MQRKKHPGTCKIDAFWMVKWLPFVVKKPIFKGRILLSFGGNLNHLLLFPFKKKEGNEANFFSMSFPPKIRAATRGPIHSTPSIDTCGWLARPWHQPTHLQRSSYCSPFNSATSFPLAARSFFLSFRTKWLPAGLKLNKQNKGWKSRSTYSWRDIRWRNGVNKCEREWLGVFFWDSSGVCFCFGDGAVHTTGK